VKSQRHAPAAFFPWERPHTHCTGGWVGPRAGLDRCGKCHITGIRYPDCPARSRSLYRLSYRAHNTEYNSALLTERGSVLHKSLAAEIFCAWNPIYLYRMIKISLCTWWLQHRKLLVMFRVFSVSLQTFIDTPNFVLENRVQYSTVCIPNVFCNGHFQIINCVGIVRIYWGFLITCIYHNLLFFPIGETFNLLLWWIKTPQTYVTEYLSSFFRF
jgi:hypothetical protein